MLVAEVLHKDSPSTPFTVGAGADVWDGLMTDSDYSSVGADLTGNRPYVMDREMWWRSSAQQSCRRGDRRLRHRLRSQGPVSIPTPDDRDHRSFGATTRRSPSDRRRHRSANRETPACEPVATQGIASCYCWAAGNVLQRVLAVFARQRQEALSDDSERASDLVFRWWRGQDLNLRPSGYENYGRQFRHTR